MRHENEATGQKNFQRKRLSVRLGEGFILAMQFCTILPTPAFRSASIVDSDVRRSVMYYPLLGSLIGFLMWCVSFCFSGHLPILLVGTLVVMTEVLITGGLHMDGLMDMADALGSRKRGEAALAIMKDSRVGAMGVLAGVFAVLLKVGALASLPGHVSNLMVYLFVPAVARASMVLAMQCAPYARSSGGLGQMFAERIPKSVILLTWVLPLFLTALLSLSVFLATRVAHFAHFATLFATSGYLVSAIFITLGFTKFCRHRFGGMTGDMYGSLEELIAIWGWLWFVMFHGVLA